MRYLERRRRRRTFAVRYDYRDLIAMENGRENLRAGPSAVQSRARRFSRPLRKFFLAPGRKNALRA